MQKNEVIENLGKKRLNKKIITFAIIGVIGIVLIAFIILSVVYFGSDKDIPVNGSANETGLIDKPEHFINDTITVVNQTGNQTITSTGSSTSGGSSGGGGSGGSSGGGESGCSPSLNCDYYYDLGECGNGLFDGCSNVLECLDCLDGEVCVNGSCVAEEVSWDDYISYWKFDGDADDETGINNGTIFGDARFVEGQNGQALEFDGEGDYVEANSILSILSYSNNYSVCFWIYFDKVTSNSNGIMSQIIDSGSRLEIHSINSIAPEISFGHYNGSSYNAVKADTTVTENVWYHFCAINYANQTKRMYKDGIDDTAASTNTLSPGSSAQNLQIGKVSTTYFNGSIDDVLIFNRSLSADEILQIYNLMEDCSDIDDCSQRDCKSLVTCDPNKTGGYDYWDLKGCAYNYLDSGIVCDDNLFCTFAGTSVCDGVGNCEIGIFEDCSDSIACTDDSCVEGVDSCIHQHIVNDDNCLVPGEICDVLLDCVLDPCAF